MESFKKHVQAQEGYDQLRRLLMTGQVAPGSRIGEVEWSKRLDVHRPALREAMRVLAHEGLLEVGEKGGFFVPVLDDNDLREILETRAVIEAGAIRKITSEDNQIDEQFQPLANICDVMETLLDQDLEFGFVEADRRFHDTLVSLTKNSKLISLYRQAPLPIRPSPEADKQTRKSNGLQTLADHRELVELLEQGRIEDAVQLLQRHLHVSSALMGAVY